MRKPRDFNAELLALNDRAKSLKERKVRQLGELVAATGADALDAETLAGGLLAMMEASDAAREETWRKRGQASFSAGRAGLLQALKSATLAARRTTAARHRLEAARARTDTRAWVVNRRERTRQLIELGGLVSKAGLVDLTGDDRAVLYGALLAIADMLRKPGGAELLQLWRRRGRRVFEAEASR